MKNIDKIGRVSASSLLKGTGKNWDEWIRLLNRAGASAWTHQEIVAHLKKKYKLTLWWQQCVAGGFEVHIGRRKEGQNGRGEYTVTATKTVAVSGFKAWKFLTSTAGMEMWLRPLSAFDLTPGAQFECAGEVFGEVRTMKAGQYVRLRWQETEWSKPTTLYMSVASRSKTKCVLIISHDGFKTERQREWMRAHWKERLLEVAQRMEQAD